MRLPQLRIDPSFRPGTPVSVEITDRVLLLSALATYGIPLVSILAGAAAGAAVIGSDLGTLAGSVLALAVVIAGFSRFRRRLERVLLASLIIRPRT
jgi:positive regulator of sigma E activity